MQITTRRDGPSTSVQVSGAPTEAGTRRLAAMLGAMAWTEGERATIHLSGISSVGSEVLRVLRTARTRAQGRLTVTAERPEARFSLALVGLGEMIWPEHDDRDGGASQTPPASRHPGAACPRVSTPSLGPSQVTRDRRSGE